VKGANRLSVIENRNYYKHDQKQEIKQDREYWIIDDKLRAMTKKESRSAKVYGDMAAPITTSITVLTESSSPDHLSLPIHPDR
jgi:hypothetical protein